jgi:hypothetical protein
MGVHGDECSGGQYGPDPLCDQCNIEQGHVLVAFLTIWGVGLVVAAVTAVVMLVSGE